MIATRSARSKGIIVTVLLISGTALLHTSAVERAAEERLSFQTSGPWSPRTNLNADVAMVYGIGQRMPANIETWRQHGYTIHVMTGVAWGQYQDYLNGEFDGQNHWDQAQTQSDGKPILHGGNRNVPYISPGENYGKYLTVGVKRALDAGAQAIHLEEPEFWARGGWEENFKREWKAYYQEDWQPPNSSPDAQYRASKLKYYLYRRALSQIFDFAKEYGKTNNRAIRCYVPTHSLINYAHWRIVSPESSLIDVGADGYIAQVWTGTARTANLYEGRRKERTFETAFLEYGAMQNLVRASGRRVWYLNDPIEDDPNHDWEDYRTNWESTLTASLLQSEVWHYEIMPWPDRVFNSRHPLKSIAPERTVKEQEQAPAGTGLGGFGRGNPNVERVGIPKPYETELQTVIGALGDMKQSEVRWENAGTGNTGVLISDTMMFQRADPQPSDANLGSFYGLAMPLLKRGVPVEPVQIESANTSGFLNRYKLLLLTYEGQKPPKPEFHAALAKWVRDGGALVVVDDDSDPYNARSRMVEHRSPSVQDSAPPPVRGAGTSARCHWTPQSRQRRRGPRGPIAGGTHLQGRRSRDGSQGRASGCRRSQTNLEGDRFAGAAARTYLVAAGLDESLPEGKPYVLRGSYLNLFDPELAVLSDVTIAPGTRMLLLDLNRVKGTGSQSRRRSLPRARRKDRWQDTAVPGRRYRRHQRHRPSRPLRRRPSKCWWADSRSSHHATTFPEACCGCASRTPWSR